MHVGKQKLGLTDEEYRHILNQHTGKLSSADPDFSDEDFRNTIFHFQALGFSVKRHWEQSRPRDPDDLPTPGQLRLISHLWKDIGKYVPGAEYPPYQRGFYERIHIPSLGPQTRSDSIKLIEILKVRLKRELRAATLRRR